MAEKGEGKIGTGATISIGSPKADRPLTQEEIDGAIRQWEGLPHPTRPVSSTAGTGWDSKAAYMKSQRIRQNGQFDPVEQPPKGKKT